MALCRAAGDDACRKLSPTGARTGAPVEGGLGFDSRATPPPHDVVGLWWGAFSHLQRYLRPHFLSDYCFVSAAPSRTVLCSVSEREQKVLPLESQG